MQGKGLGIVTLAVSWFLEQDWITTFLATVPNLCLVTRTVVAHRAVWSLRGLSGGCRARSSLNEGGLTWNTDASLAPSKNENQTAATTQENSVSVCYEYQT